MDDRGTTVEVVDETSEGGATDEEGEPVPVESVGEDDADPTAREEAALERARSVSRLLDEAVRVPGTDFRVGLDPVLGVLPGAGDAAAAALSLYPVVEAYRLDAPRKTLARMLGLVAVDAVAGSVPLVGPLFDAFWKANEWNVRALERHVEGE